jgi:DNA repair exonuclease SbcCD ATPase subunit
MRIQPQAPHPLDFRNMSDVDLVRKRAEIESTKNDLDAERQRLRREGAMGRYAPAAHMQAFEVAINGHKANLAALNAEQAARRADRRTAATAEQPERQRSLELLDELIAENEQLKRQLARAAEGRRFMDAAQIVLSEVTFLRILSRSRGASS